MTPPTFSVATLNVWGLPPPLTWPPRHVRYPRVRRFLDQNAFDVALLQEVWRPDPAGWRDADIHGPPASEPHSGLVLVTRFPVVERVHRAFGAGAPFIEKLWTAKGYLRVTLDVEGTRVDVLNTHLQAYDTKKDALTRARQVDILLGAVRDDVPTVLAGDFNVHAGNAADEAVVARIAASGFADAGVDAGPTFTWWGKRERFDRVWLRGLATVDARVLKPRAVLSDHLPLAVTARCLPR